MSTLDYRTAGESHGQKLIVLVEGMPAGVRLDETFINGELRRRQGGYGRGARMRIETDVVNIVSGIRRGVTIGSPIAMEIGNKDWRIDEAPEIHRPRPGHADLAGSLKWLTTNCRTTLERASARETAARVAAGAMARCLLNEFHIGAVGFVQRIYDVAATLDPSWGPDDLVRLRNANEVYCPDATVDEDMSGALEPAKRGTGAGDENDIAAGDAGLHIGAGNHLLVEFIAWQILWIFVLSVDVLDHLAAAHPEHDIVAVLGGNIGKDSAEAATTNYRDLASWHVLSNAAD